MRQFLGERQLTVLALLLERRSVAVKDIPELAPTLTSTVPRAIETLVDTLVVRGLITCSTEDTRPTSTIRITYEGEQAYEEAKRQKTVKPVFDANSVLVFEEVDKALVAGRKVCFVASADRKAPIAKMFREKYGVRSDLIVLSLGDAQVDWSVLKVPGRPDYDVFLEPSTLKAELGGALLYIKTYKTDRRALKDGSRLRKVRSDKGRAPESTVRRERVARNPGERKIASVTQTQGCQRG